MLLFRSAAPGMHDLAAGGTTTFGGVRAGCAVCLIPAGGILNSPEAASGCACSYNFQTSYALVPGAARDDQWYVFGGTGTTGPITRLRLNLGAPGDRRDTKGTAWLAAPHPNPRWSVPVPVSVAAERKAWYYSPTAISSVKDPVHPWLYTSGIEGKATVLVELRPAVTVAVPKAAVPAVDGVLNDACWRDAAAVPFERSIDRTDPLTTLHIARDDKALYVAYRRVAPVVNGKALPLVSTQTGEDVQWWIDDDVEVCVTDSAGKTAAFFGVACGGGWFDGTIDLAAGRQGTTEWDGQWQRAVKKSEKEWSAEMAIPLASLAQAGVTANGLRLNAKSQNQSGVGVPVIFLTDPGARYLIECKRFLAVADRDPASDSASYTVRLHTAERAKLQPGQRVFDIAIQGQALVKGLDIAKETGGAGIPFVKELKGVAAGRTLRIDLQPVEGKGLPLLCAVEVVRE